MSDKLPMAPDYTYYSTLQSCPRKFFYRYERQIASTEEKAVLKAGSALHAGLETLYKSDFDLDRAEQALVESWAGYEVPATADKSYLTVNHLSAVLRNYAKHYADEPRQIVATGDTLFGERSFVMDWGGETVGGKIDLVQKQNGDLWLVDFKTTTGWLNKWWAEQRAFELSHQLRLYTAAVQQELDETLSGSYINGIYMGEKALDPDHKWENRKSSRFRLFGPYSFRSSALKETWYWCRESRQEIQDRWRREIELEAAGERGEFAWPQNTHNRYGCNRCEFQPLCTANPVVRDGLIESRYVEWEPTGQLLSGADSVDN